MAITPSSYTTRPSFGAPRPQAQFGLVRSGGYGTVQAPPITGFTQHGIGPREKKLWQYGSRWARAPQSRFGGLTTGFGRARPKRLGDYNLGWESPSARGGGPSTGGLTYSPRIRNPIALDVARSRALAGRQDPQNILPGVGPGFAPPRRFGQTSMAEARQWI